MRACGMCSITERGLEDLPGVQRILPLPLDVTYLYWMDQHFDLVETVKKSKAFSTLLDGITLYDS